MFSQLLTPVADSLGLSFLMAILPIVVVLVLLGLLRLPGLDCSGCRAHRCPRNSGHPLANAD